MRTRLWISGAMLVAGTALLVTANLATAAGGHGPQFKKGGIFQLGVVSEPGSIDPQLTGNPVSWVLLYATGAKLYDYPDRAGTAGMRLVPEVASSFAVSKSGKRYTFTIRKGFRFSDGTAVTARSFKYAIERIASSDLHSWGSPFITDPSGTNIVGARAAVAGKTKKVSGVVVKGDKLIVNLTRPDSTFMAKITMPLFQATSTKLPLDKPVGDVASMDDMPSAGPYAFSRHHADLTVVRQNPYWKRGPGRKRPRRLTGVRVLWNRNEQTAFQQVKASELDAALPVPAAERGGLAKQYGVNKTRFWVKPNGCTGWLVPNTSRKVFRNVNRRKALNYAVRRKDYIDLLGPYAGRPWSHILSPGVPGWRDVQPYPLRPNLAKARKLAGPLKNLKINVWYVESGFFGNAFQFQSVRRDLIRLGFEPENIKPKSFAAGMDIFVAMSKKDNEADLGVSMGWCQDYPDPYDWININFYGKSIRDEGNTNYSYFKSPKWDRRMEQAARLTGPDRFKAYGQLDIDLMRQAAPIVPMTITNTAWFFSKRVDRRSLVYQSIYGWSIPALALK